MPQPGVQINEIPDELDANAQYRVYANPHTSVCAGVATFDPGKTLVHPWINDGSAWWWEANGICLGLLTEQQIKAMLVGRLARHYVVRFVRKPVNQGFAEAAA